MNNNYTPETTNTGELLTAERQPTLSDLTIAALNELSTCLDMVEDIMCRGFGADIGPRPGKEIKTLLDATENLVENASFLHAKISLVMTLLLSHE